MSKKIPLILLIAIWFMAAMIFLLAYFLVMQGLNSTEKIFEVNNQLPSPAQLADSVDDEVSFVGQVMEINPAQMLIGAKIESAMSLEKDYSLIYQDKFYEFIVGPGTKFFRLDFKQDIFSDNSSRTVRLSDLKIGDEVELRVAKTELSKANNFLLSQGILPVSIK